MRNKLTKRQRASEGRVVPGKLYPIEDGIKLSIELSKVKFTESMDVAVRLGVDAKKSDQNVRGRIVYPHGTGRSGKRIAVFARGDQADIAKANGAQIVGFEELAEQVKQEGKIDCDVVLATPEAMRIVGTLGPILGPRGLMPNPKEGTVTTDMAVAIKNVSGGVRFRTDKNGIIHCTIGTVKMNVQELKENLENLIVELKKLKPTSSKGVYLRGMTLSSTMGPGIDIDLTSLAG